VSNETISATSSRLVMTRAATVLVVSAGRVEAGSPVATGESAAPGAGPGTRSDGFVVVVVAAGACDAGVVFELEAADGRVLGVVKVDDVMDGLVDAEVDVDAVVGMVDVASVVGVEVGAVVPSVLGVVVVDGHNGGHAPCASAPPASKMNDATSERTAATTARAALFLTPYLALSTGSA
jgi:hypothetical protein